MQARSGAIHSISFRDFTAAYAPFTSIPNAQRFTQQAQAFRVMLQSPTLKHIDPADTSLSLALGRCLATIAITFRPSAPIRAKFCS